MGADAWYSAEGGLPVVGPCTGPGRVVRRRTHATGEARLPGLIKDLTVVTVEGGPHNIAWTHRAQEFLRGV